MIRKLLSSILVILHIFTFGYVRDGLAILAESASYKLQAAAYTQGGQNRTIGQPTYTKLLIHADGPSGSTNFTDEAGKNITNQGSIDAYTKLMLHLDGTDGSTTFNGDARIDTAETKFGGGSVRLDGVGDYLSLADSDDWNFGNENFTIDMWVNLSDSTQNGALGGQYINDSNMWYFAIVGDYPNRALVFTSVVNGVDVGHFTTTAWQPAANTWYHVALVRNSTNLYCFINGVMQSFSSTPTPASVMPDLAAEYLIGDIPRPGGHNYFKGWIDEYRVSKGIARWTGDFTPPLGPYGQVVADTTQKKFGTSSALFDGSSYLNIPDSDDWNFGTDTFTIDGWYMFGTGGDEAHCLWNQFVNLDNSIIFLYAKLQNRLHFQVVNGGTVTRFVCPFTPAANTWYHIALVRIDNGDAATSWRIFVNGVSQTLTLHLGNWNVTLSNLASPVYIGRSGYLVASEVIYGFEGYIDELRVSKGIARWTSNFTPPSAPYTLTSGDPQGTTTNTIKDSIGEASIGPTSSASYKLKAGFVYVSQTSTPELKQIIPNQAWQENASNPNAFDLDNYFLSPDGLSLIYTVAGYTNITVSIDATTHLVSFSQPQAWSGTETVKFTATDSEGNSTQGNAVSLQIEGVNNPPVLDFIPDITVNENDLVKITPNATDLDGDAIIYSFTARLNSNGEWQTDYISAGTYITTITATDSTGLTDSQAVTIIVRNVNRPPTITQINGIPITQGQPLILPNINEGEVLQITPTATDLDNETIIFGYSSQTAAIDSQGKWQIGYDAAGTHTITVTASDDIATIAQDVRVTVLNMNRPPVPTLTLSKYTVSPNETFTINLTAIDPDSDSMTYTVKKDGAELSSGAITPTARITLTTSFSTIGDHTISAIVTDSGGAAASPLQVSVDVSDPNLNRDAINPVMGDFNGDALSDLGLHNSDTGTWEICLSDKGIFTAALDWLTGFGASKDFWPIGGDFNGDSKTDIGIYHNLTGELKVAISDGTRFTAQTNPWLAFPSASYSWLPFTGNFNGDKFTDFGLYNKDTGEWKIAKGTGTGFDTFTTWLSGFGGTGYSPLTGDFNGDGLTDICIFKKTSGEFKVAFSNTKGFAVQPNAWATGYATDKDPIISDFNNDGLTDIGWFDKSQGKWYQALNTSGAFTDNGEWLANFGSSTVESGHTGDFNGDGLTDAATFDKDAQGINRWAVKLISKKPQDLLVEIANGIGGKTQITYDYAADYGTQELPFPVYVAKSISSINTVPVDRAATYTQNLTYEGGWFDSTEREFRGFRKIKVTDPITGNYTETYFYQGKPPEDGALKGQIEKIFAYDGTGKLISQAINTWEVRKAGPTDGVLGFPYLKEVVQTVYEYGATDPLSTKNIFTYDNLGNIATETCQGDITVAGDEKSTETTYSLAYEQGHNRPIEIALKDKDGTVINNKLFEYDSSGNLTKESASLRAAEGGEAISTQYSYDSFGNVTSTTNAENHTVLTDYESIFYTYPQTITNELGHTISYTYNPKFGVVTHLTDVNNNTTETVYDTLSRITTQKNTQGQTVTTYEYSDFNTKITKQGTVPIIPIISRTEYIDGLGRKYKTVSDGEDGTQKRQVSSEIYFDLRGLTEKESLPHYIDEDPSQISYITYTYDKRGRVITTTSDFPGIVKDATSYIYYITPLYVETQPPLGAKKGTKKDVYGNVIEITELTQEGTYHTYYEYDLKGNLTKLTDSQGNITQIQYDSLGRKILLNDPDTGITTYAYDKLGNLLTQTDNKGNTIIMEYDTLSRLIAKRGQSPESQQGTVPVTLATYEYDDATKPNCLGRLSKVTSFNSINPTNPINSYYYDTEGRAIKLDKTIDSTTYTTQTTYDLIGRTTSITYPDNTIVTYEYDINSGLLEKLYNSTNPSNPITYVSDITYNAAGQIRTIKYGNSTETNYTYGQDLRLSRILTTDNRQLTTFQDLNYSFDKSGNITTLTDNLRSNIRSYTYDDLSRLTRAENTPDPNGGYTTFNYTYSPIGNMTYKSDVGFMTYGEQKGLSPQGTVPITAPHAVTTAGSNSYSYDANGNMTSAPNKLMTYDIENRLIKIEESATITTFIYDTDGSRLKKGLSPQGTVPEQWTVYIGSLFEKDSSGEIRKHIFAGSNRVATVTSNPVIPAQAGIHYYHSDHLGSSNVITNEAGAQVSFTEYTPYGAVATSTGTYNTPYKFTGKELDNTGLYFYAWRYYDPTIGRFCQPDTIIPEPYNPQSLNRYSYCDNNPLNYTDPSGHFKLGKWLGKIFGAIAGVITTVATGNPVLGFQVYSAISSVYDTGYALAHGADPLRTIGAFVAANIMAAVLPGGGTYDNLFLQVGIHAARGAVIGATTAAIAGTDIGEGALWGGAVGAAVGFASSNQVNNWLQGKGFASNETVAQKQQALAKADLNEVVNAEKELSQSALATPRQTEAAKTNQATQQANASAESLTVDITPKAESPWWEGSAKIIKGAYDIIKGTINLIKGGGSWLRAPKIMLPTPVLEDWKRRVYGGIT